MARTMSALTQAPPRAAGRRGATFLGRTVVGRVAAAAKVACARGAPGPAWGRSRVGGRRAAGSRWHAAVLAASTAPRETRRRRPQRAVAPTAHLSVCAARACVTCVIQQPYCPFQRTSPVDGGAPCALQHRRARCAGRVQVPGSSCAARCYRAARGVVAPTPTPTPLVPLGLSCCGQVACSELISHAPGPCRPALPPSGLQVERNASGTESGPAGAGCRGGARAPLLFFSPLPRLDDLTIGRRVRRTR